MVGALVTNVVVDSPADVAGIETGDVVTTFEDSPVENIRDLMFAVASSGSKREVELGIRRGAEFLKLTARLDVNPENEALFESRGETGKTASDTLGLSLAPLSNEVRKRFQIDDTMTGVLVVGTGGVNTGLSRGDVILRVGTQLVSKPSDVVGLVNTAREKGQSSVVFYVANSFGRRFIAVSLS